MASTTPLSILGLALLYASPVLAGTYACGPAVNGNGSLGGWKVVVWNDMVALRQMACSKTVHGFYWLDETTSNGVRLQVKVEHGFTNNHCWDVLENLMFRCFDTAHANKVAHWTGSWNSDPESHEWYWFDVTGSNGWCQGTSILSCVHS